MEVPSLGEFRELVGRVSALERPPLGTAVTHNRVSRIEERVAELAGRVIALEPTTWTSSGTDPSGSMLVSVPEEKYRLIEQVLEAAVAYSDVAWDDGRKIIPVMPEAVRLLEAARAYREKVNQ